MELRQIRYFCEVAKHEHVSNAAEALFISQPALSRTIKNLEEELKVPLFEPKGRGVQLTPYGKYFYEVSKEVLNSLDGATHKLMQLGTNASVAISVINEIPELFTHLIRAFFKAHPKVPVSESPMREGVISSFDSTFGGFLLSYQSYDSKTIQSKKLMEDTFVLLIPAGHPMAERSFVALSELHNLPHVGHASFQLPRPIEQSLAHPKYLVSDLLSVARLVSQGCGISVIPMSSWFLLQPDLDTFFSVDARPRTIPIQYTSPNPTIYISYPRKSEYLPHEQMFLEYCGNFFSDLHSQMERFQESKYEPPH